MKIRVPRNHEKPDALRRMRGTVGGAVC
jgi:hypothetical protein